MLKNRDYILDILIIVYSLLGLLGLFAVSESYFYTQLIFYIFSFALYFTLPLISKKYLELFVWLLYVGTIFLLIFLFFFGRNVRGTAGWVSFGFFNFQPGEFSKFVLLYTLSLILTLKMSRIKKSIYSLAIFIPTATLILLQPDFGMFFVLAVVFFSLLFISVLKFKEFLVLSFFVFILSIGFYGMLKDYQKVRITSFLNQQSDLLGSNYNVFQSQIALGSAGIFGKGVNNNTQVKLGFLPENHTDFVFAGSTEAYGFIYAFLLFGIFTVLVVYLSYFYFLKLNNPFSLCYSFGLIVAFFTQTVLNVGMNLGIFPVTGLTLPFVSYGGTSLLTYFITFSVLHTFRK